MSSPNVWAVVVTYNRAPLLLRCVEAIRAGTRQPAQILVINNGSTDETEEWLRAQTDVQWITQENCGGAGGFYTGIKKAFEAGAEWIWVMDDDGVPAPDCLEKLLAASRGYGLLNPVAVVEAGSNQLSFELRGSYDLKQLRAEEPNVLPDWALPFNGTLIARETVTAVGLPKHEMFIWGDEVEYYLRCRQRGIRCASVLDALHVHPPDRARPRAILGGMLRVKTPDKKWEHIFFRNTGFIYLRYFGFIRFSAQIVEYSLYLLLYERSPARWLRFLRYFADGAFDRYRLPI